jgi:hypothetical protein
VSFAPESVAESPAKRHSGEQSTDTAAREGQQSRDRWVKARGRQWQVAKSESVIPSSSTGRSASCSRRSGQRHLQNPEGGGICATVWVVDPEIVRT